MYPYGANRCLTPDNLGHRSVKCPSLLRLNSVGEITSDENVTPIVQNPTRNTSSMGMSTLLNKSNIFGRQSLCANKQNKGSAAKFEDIESGNYRMFTSTNPHNPASYCPSLKMDVPLISVFASMPDRDRFQQMRMNKPCLEFHPFVTNSCVNSFPENRSNPLDMENKNKRMKSCINVPSHCYRGFSGNKKKNRYNRYNWQPPSKVDKPPCQGSPPQIHSPKIKQKEKKSETVESAEISVLKEQPAVITASSKSSDNSGKQTCCDITSQMEQLSLGEKVALEKAKDSASMKQGAESDTPIDWFSMTRQHSEKEFPSYIQKIQEDEEDSEDNLCNISDEVRDLFTCSDGAIEFKEMEHTNTIASDTPKSEDLPSPVENLETANDAKNASVGKTDPSTESQKDKSAFKCMNEQSSRSENDLKIPMVLYVRDNKKCRTSRKNRRKSGKKISADDSAKCASASALRDADNGKKRKFNLFSETYPQTRTSSSQFNVHSFLVAFSDEHENNTSSDSEFDWSDEDEDENDGKLGEADLLSLASFACPLSVNVICEVTKPDSRKSSANQELDALNAAWKINIQLSPSPRKPKNCDKKVHFAQDDVLTETHAAENWCRKGPWEEFARDRERFSRRIQEVEPIVGPVLKSDHRNKIRNYLSQFTADE